ncbi:hypothetical protein BJ165DRAFT_615128 [Panaeolus papilionaceus]|nr:hypothetical protein BJ165DRAFT_615128 [Panaeolus papilionaceus]
MTILIIGGTGNTGLSLAKLLHNAGHSILLTSRSGIVPSPYAGVSFDWFNPATYENPFKNENAPDGTPIERIYIIGPPVVDPMPFAKPLIDLAIAKGVKRFVLLSGTSTGPGTPFTGKIHGYLNETLGIDFVVLRASRFMQNFEKYHLPFIKSANHIFSTAGDGRIPFVSCEDIAQAAYHALTSNEAGRRDVFVVGPQLLTYDEVVATLSTAIDRPITHKRLTDQEYKQLLTSFGLTDDYVGTIIAERDRAAASDLEAGAFNLPQERKYVGKRTLKEYFEENAAIWK